MSTHFGNDQMDAPTVHKGLQENCPAPECQDATAKPPQLTVGDLRREIDGLPDDTPVILANSAEGHGYSPLQHADPGLYAAGSPYSGEHYLTEDIRQAMDDPDEYEPAPAGAVPAVFLWPSA